MADHNSVRRRLCLRRIIFAGYACMIGRTYQNRTTEAWSLRRTFFCPTGYEPTPNRGGQVASRFLSRGVYAERSEVLRSE
ncbi:MAG: hypothetical protein FWD02_06095 [Bacteroidales bacterium]|nr:hypothetical protein [Bacteroidales bacterium]